MHCGITHRVAAVRLLVFAVIWLCGSGPLLAQTFNTIYIFGAGGSPRGTLVEATYAKSGKCFATTRCEEASAFFCSQPKSAKPRRCGGRARGPLTPPLFCILRPP